VSVEVACECDGFPPHSHVYRWQDAEGRTTGLLTERPKWAPDPYDVRVWVDWKAVARVALTGG
jgi:hypothetical protein